LTDFEKSISWLLSNKGREGHWFWRWKFKTVDRAVQFNPDKFGWPWFLGTVSWSIPTAFSLIALRQSPYSEIVHFMNRIQLGVEMLREQSLRARRDGTLAMESFLERLWSRTSIQRQ
jgi:hypothetical protein